MKKRYAGFYLFSVVLILSIQSATAQTRWDGEFGLGLSDEASDMIETPDGDIFVSGSFDHAGPHASSGLARWDGEQWHPVADFDGDVETMLIHDDILYAAGTFTSVTPPGEAEMTANRIARKSLDTGEWSTMGSGLDDGSVRALVVNENGALYAGGCFRQSGSRSLDRVALWDGSEWQPLKAGTEDENGVSACVDDLIYDDANSRLILGGNFRTAVNWNAQEETNESIILGGVAYYDGRWRQVGGGISDEYPGLPNPAVHTIYLHDDGDLYVGGTLWTAFNDGDREEEVDVRTLARWDGAQWHSVFDENRGSVREIVPDGDILHLGGWFETAATDGQEPLTANSYARYDVDAGEMVTNAGGESPTGQGFTDGGATDATVRSRGTIRAILLKEDEVYVAGKFDRAEFGDELTEHRRIKRIARWDGESWHALGTGVSDVVTDLAALGDTLFLAGEFHHVANRGEMFLYPHAAVFDRQSGLFVPSETLITPWEDSRGFRVTADPSTGTGYAAVGTRTITWPDGDTESGNVLEWNSIEERWNPLGRLSQDGMFNLMMTDMLVVDRHLYISGRFDNVFGQDDPSGRGSLVRYDLDDDTFGFPDLGDQVAAHNHYALAMTRDANCLYAALWITSDIRPMAPGNVMCLDLETGAANWVPGYLLLPSGIVDLHKDGEYLYIAGSGSGIVNFYDDDGDETSVELSSGLQVLHPETESWVAWSGDFGSYVRGLTVAGNSVYAAGRISHIDGTQTWDYDGIARHDMGTGKWHIIGGADGREHIRDGVAEIDGELWTWGDFRFTGSSGSAYLARYPELSEGTSGPVAGRYQTDLTLALHQDQSVDVPVYVPNLGDEALDWNLVIDASDAPVQGKISSTAQAGNSSDEQDSQAGWIETDASSGTAEAGSVDPVMVSLDPSGLESGVYEATLEITGNDAAGIENEIPVSLTVNPLSAATEPYPADGEANVSGNAALSWENQRFPDEVTVYLGTSELLGDDDMIYQGEAIDSLSADSLVERLEAPLEPYQTYYWRVDQSNTVGEAEGEVWSFMTAAGENMIVVGDQDWGVGYYPIYPSQNPAWIQTLFPGSEIGRSGTITTLAYHYLGEADAELDVQVYMGTTGVDAFEDSDSWLPVSEMTLVYDGPMKMEQAAESYWLDLELAEPFEYDASENLVIGVFSDDDRDLGNALNDISFYATSRDENLSLFWYGEDEVDPANAPGNGYTWAELPDIRLTYGEDDEEIEPGVPVLSSPANEAGDIDADDVVLTWKNPADADSVQLQVSVDSGFDGDLIVSSHLYSDSESYGLDELDEQTTYYWRLRAWQEGVTGDWSDTWSFTTQVPTSVAKASDVPEQIELNQNYPNPFNPDTQIRYGLPANGHVRITIYNPLGQRVTTLVDETQSAGWHEVRFDGRSMSSGVYLYEMVTGDVVETRAMMLVK